MDMDELLELIESGLKDVRAQLMKNGDPNAAARKAQPVESRLEELEHAVWMLGMKVESNKSVLKILEMRVARLTSAAAPATEPKRRRKR